MNSKKITLIFFLLLLLYPFLTVAENNIRLEGIRPDGSSFSISDFYGKKPILVNFFADWCAPCRIELPILAKLEKEYPDIQFIVVDSDSPDLERTIKFISSLPMPETILNISGSEKIKKDWRVFGLPETVFLDKSGKVRFRYTGGKTEEEFQNILNKLLKTSK